MAPGKRRQRRRLRRPRGAFRPGKHAPTGIRAPTRERTPAWIRAPTRVGRPGGAAFRRCPGGRLGATGACSRGIRIGRGHVARGFWGRWGFWGASGFCGTSGFRGPGSSGMRFRSRTGLPARRAGSELRRERIARLGRRLDWRLGRTVVGHVPIVVRRWARAASGTDPDATLAFGLAEDPGRSPGRSRWRRVTIVST